MRESEGWIDVAFTAECGWARGRGAFFAAIALVLCHPRARFMQSCEVRGADWPGFRFWASLHGFVLLLWLACEPAGFPQLTGAVRLLWSAAGGGQVGGCVPFRVFVGGCVGCGRRSLWWLACSRGEGLGWAAPACLVCVDLPRVCARRVTERTVAVRLPARVCSPGCVVWGPGCVRWARFLPVPAHAGGAGAL
jgi:hypothetical protein